MRVHTNATSASESLAVLLAWTSAWISVFILLGKNSDARNVASLLLVSFKNLWHVKYQVVCSIHRMLQWPKNLLGRAEKYDYWKVTQVMWMGGCWQGCLVWSLTLSLRSVASWNVRKSVPWPFPSHKLLELETKEGPGRLPNWASEVLPLSSTVWTLKRITGLKACRSSASSCNISVLLSSGIDCSSSVFFPLQRCEGTSSFGQSKKDLWAVDLMCRCFENFVRVPTLAPLQSSKCCAVGLPLDRQPWLVLSMWGGCM